MNGMYPTQWVGVMSRERRGTLRDESNVLEKRIRYPTQRRDGTCSEKGHHES